MEENKKKISFNLFNSENKETEKKEEILNENHENNDLRQVVANAEKVQYINENSQKNTSKNIVDLDVNLMNVDDKQPFKIREDTTDFKMLKESIEILGIRNPLQVVKKEDGYEVIEGHRRLYIAKQFELKQVPCIVIEEDTEKNKLQLVDGNITARQSLLTSEKVKAYKMKYDAMESMGKISKQELAEQDDSSIRTIERLLKLSSLSDEMLELIDEFELSKKFGFSKNVAGMFTDLNKEQQNAIFEYIVENEIVIDEKNAKKIKALNNITKESIAEVFNKKQKTDKRKNIAIPYKKIEKYFSEDQSSDEKVEIIIKALEQYFSENIK